MRFENVWPMLWSVSRYHMLQVALRILKVDSARVATGTCVRVLPDAALNPNLQPQTHA